jgi:phosphoketolase
MNPLLLSESELHNYRSKYPAAARWASGYGRIEHTPETQTRIFSMVETLAPTENREAIFALLIAADRVASAGMWLVAHETYAQKVYLDGRPLQADDFKPKPEGHTGGSLNMVPAYVGYMAINALTGITRSWIMGQGHCVAAIDSVNLLLDNMTPAHAERYSVSDDGLTRYVGDFYSYRLRPDGRPDSPLGSHVNAHTAGGLAEGGYLGFVELQYVHMPLPGERLVAFLSDGAFEEQRGSDWAPRWWRAEDSGLVAPIMIKNGRRLDQRTTLAQDGNHEWFAKHLELHHFDPIQIDGRDPAAFAWLIWEMERRLTAAGERVKTGTERYPVRLPYGIAVSLKGAGFYGEGTNLAHNLPLKANPHNDPTAAANFNDSAKKLWVPKDELTQSIQAFQTHSRSGRPRERDHALALRRVELKQIPPLNLHPTPTNRTDFSSWKRSSPMDAVDETFLSLVKANPQLRPRVGNPDEMRSNRLIQTLETLKFRVTDPEPGIPEEIQGSVITALNEEAVVSAAFGNKGGINLVHSYEAFGPKIQGVIRQEIIFAQHAKETGRPAGWLSVPVVMTSHTWENSKNELSHQDPALAEAMLGEQSDLSRVVFPPDFNTAAVVMRGVYQTQGQVWTLVVPKSPIVPELFSPEEAERLLAHGAIHLDWAGYGSAPDALILTAIGAFQLEEVLKASRQLAEQKVPHRVIAMLEPGRFRKPRTASEAAHATPQAIRDELYPPSATRRLFVCHTRPEPMLGTLQPLNTGAATTRALGFLGLGGTLTVEGMLTVNRCTAKDILAEVATR